MDGLLPSGPQVIRNGQCDRILNSRYTVRTRHSEPRPSRVVEIAEVVISL